MSPGPWNWLEVVKLGAGVLTPAALAVFGIYINRVTKRFEQRQWRSQKLTEKRLAVYDDLAPQFNDLLCYFTYIGCWRDLDPPAVVGLKRIIDKKVYLAAPLFSPKFFSACMEFQNLCFETYTGWGRDATLRTQSQRRQESRSHTWQNEWNAYFSNQPSNPEEIRRAYNQIMNAFSEDIGVNPSFATPSSGRVPSDIR